jgi:hypothetical protein
MSEAVQELSFLVKSLSFDDNYDDRRWYGGGWYGRGYYAFRCMFLIFGLR